MSLKKITAPIERLKNLIDKKSCEGKQIDQEILKDLGVFILKGVLPKHVIQPYSDIYFSQKEELNRCKTEFHLTEIILCENHPLLAIIKENEFIRLGQSLFSGNVGSDFIRIVKKDSENFQAVFLHQDTGYQIGSFEKYSFFIPLSKCNFDNGGLMLYPGTHHFGYLGDVGEIADILPDAYPCLVPDLDMGDILVMHSAVWHKSPINMNLTDRVYLEVHILNAREASVKNIICGESNTEWRNLYSSDELFINSKTQKLKKLYQNIHELKKNST
jgi:hypothetical protein